MAREAPDRWREKPAKPLRYPLWQRLNDRIAGRRDGKSGIPASSDDEAPAVTPYHAALARQFNGAADKEHLNMEIETFDQAKQLDDLNNRIINAEQQRADARKRLEEMPATAPEEVLRVRNAVELHLPEEVGRTRRQREYDKKRQPLVDAEAEAERQAQRLRLEHGRLAAEVATTRRIFATRARLHYAHAERRCHTYERQLLRYHPNAAELNARLPLWRPQLPPWARDPDTEPGREDQ
jgi:hypothetical protein